MYEADGPMLIAAWGAVALALVAVWLARRPADARTGVASGLGHDGAWPSTTAVLAPERWPAGSAARALSSAPPACSSCRRSHATRPLPGVWPGSGPVFA